MARGLQRLSAKQVEKAKQPGYYCDGGGLYLQVSSNTAKSWIFRYARGGKAREMGLGSLNAVTLANARDKAFRCRAQLADGRDPLEERQAQADERSRAKRNAVTFSQYAETFIDAHKPEWGNPKTPIQWRNSLEDYAEPVLGAMPLAEIETGHVLRVLKPIWNTKRETASRVRRRIENILDAAKVDGYRSGDNPARWRGHLEHTLANTAAEVEHFAALPWEEAGAFVQALRGVEGLAARALEFTILTAVRTHVTLGALPAEFDLENAVWTIPADRMKGARGKRKEHRVPLSARAVEIVRDQLEGMIAGNPYLFPGARRGKPLSNMAMLKVLERMKRDDLTVHGFRSTFRDWASEATHHDHNAVEMSLAHTIGNKVEAAYRRGDLFEKRRHLMDDWTAYCANPKAGKVVSIKGRA